MRRGIWAVAAAAAFVSACIPALAAGSGGWELITGRPGPETLARVYGGGAQKVKVTSWSGNDRLLFEMEGGNDQLIEDAGTGNDYLEAGGGTGSDTVELYGRAGKDVFAASGGRYAIDSADRGNDMVKMIGAGGGDRFTYFLTSGRDRVTIDGGAGIDTAVVKIAAGQPVILVAKGRVMFKTEGATKAGTRIAIKSLKHVKVVDEETGRVYFRK